MKPKDFTLNYSIWREVDEIDSVLEKSGVYTLYQRHQGDISPGPILYIGQSINLKERITDHIDGDFKDKSIYFSYAEVPQGDLDRIEAALIYKFQPPQNKKGKESFNHPTTRISIIGYARHMPKEIIVKTTRRG